MNGATNAKREKYVKFSPEEDKLIMELREVHGNNWTLIAEKFNEIKSNGVERVPREIRERFELYLILINLIPFSDEEDNLLREKVAQFGENWNKIKIFNSMVTKSTKVRWILYT